MAAGDSVRAFYAAREFLFAHRDDYDTAYRDFRWPELAELNSALDWFDVMPADARFAAALRIVHEDGYEEFCTFADLSRRSNQLANRLREQGVRRGDPLLLMLGNQDALWDTILAAIKLGAVIIPATRCCGPPTSPIEWLGAGFADRHRIGGRQVRGGVRRRHPDRGRRRADGWPDFYAARSPADFAPDDVTRADDPLLLYFTSGTTAQPKLVEHTHVSYPVGHLSTMYWIGLRPGDVHLNICSPGWAKHAWSNVFAPWNAEACVSLQLHPVRRRGPARRDGPLRCHQLLRAADRLADADPGRPVRLRTPPRLVVGAGEPLNPEVIEQVRGRGG